MPATIVGFALLWAVGKGCVNQNAFTYPGDGASFSATFAFYLTVSTITAILWPLALRRTNSLSVGTLCSLAASASLGLVMLMALSKPAWWFVGSFLAGVGRIPLEISFMRFFMREGARPLDICVAVLAGDLLSCCFSLPAPPAVRFWLFTAFPFSAALLLGSAQAHLATEASVTKEEGIHGSRSLHPARDVRVIGMPLLGYTAITTISVATSHLFMSMGALGPSEQTLIHLAAPLVGAAGGIFLVRLRLYKSQLTIPVFLLAALALLPAPLFGLWYLGPIKAITLVVQETLFLSLVHASTEATREYDLPDWLLPAIISCSLSASTLLGTVIGFACESLGGVGPSPFVIIEVVSLFLLLAASILIVGMQRVKKADIQSASNKQDDGITSQAGASFAMHVFGLTMRETEIVDHLLRQKTPQQIADELFLACSTVRGHIKNIYRKADVHSRQELVEKIAEVCHSQGNPQH